MEQYYGDFVDMGKEIGWDDEIEKESEFILLPDGEYDFVVESMERERFEGSEKMSPCNMAVLTLRVKDPATGQPTTVKDRLYLNSKAEWKLSQFFLCIGQKKHGEKLKPDWAAVPTSTGRCKIVRHKYRGRDGSERESNQVQAYLEKPKQMSFTPGEF